jgi:hypothetical protein
MVCVIDILSFDVNRLKNFAGTRLFEFRIFLIASGGSPLLSGAPTAYRWVIFRNIDLFMGIKVFTLCYLRVG